MYFTVGKRADSKADFPTRDESKKLESGSGLLTYSNGDVYSGYFKGDHFHGKGKMKYGPWAQGVEYEGDWVDSCYCGQGIYTFANGDEYDGQFINDNFEGHGKL